MPKNNIDELELIVNAQSEQITRLSGDLGVLMEQVNKLVGTLTSQPAKATSKSGSPPAYSPAPSTDPLQILQLMIAAEDRGSKRTMEMFERVGAIMGSMQDSLIKGMKLANEQRQEHFREFDELTEKFSPDDDDDGGALEELGEAINFGEKIREMMNQKKGGGPPEPPPGPGGSHES